MMAKTKKKLARGLNILGNILIFFSVFFAFLTFGPAVKQEVSYQTKEVFDIPKKDLTPPNTDFSIVIPKIEAVAPVFANTDPYEKDSYLPVLLEGVAHAKGTPFPGESGNTYLFAHSTDAFYNVGRYNAIFYLLGKLEQGDEIKVFYNEEEIVYKVRNKKVVAPDEIKYLGNFGGKTLTLQTCYPPGTTINRLVVVADQVENDPI